MSYYYHRINKKTPIRVLLDDLQHLEKEYYVLQKIIQREEKNEMQNEQYVKKLKDFACEIENKKIIIFNSIKSIDDSSIRLPMELTYIQRKSREYISVSTYYSLRQVGRKLEKGEEMAEEWISKNHPEIMK